MSTIDALHKRIDKLLAIIEQRVPTETPQIKIHLFTAAEQERLSSLLTYLEVKVGTTETGHFNLRGLTDDQLDELENWLLLEQALEQENMGDAARYRRYLTISSEQLLATFMSIDENAIPVDSLAPTFEDRHNAIHTLDQTNFRYLKMSIERAAQKRINNSHLASMRMWVDTFAPGQHTK